MNHNRKPELPKTLQDEINAILERAGIEYRAGNLRRSLEIAEEAWSVIPAPVHHWDYYSQSLSADFVRDYAELRDVEAVERWLPELYAAYNDADYRDHYTLMIEAKARLTLGQDDRADKLFQRILDLYGVEGFKGAHRQYYERIAD